MIEFVSLFLGLVVGVYPVEVSVGVPVAAVELYLDGRPVGTLAGEPWSHDCDFGETLVPHELLAVARNRAGEEIGRARQLVNVPRTAEARFTLKPDETGLHTVGLAWEALDFDQPEAVNVFFDGELLEIENLERIALPSHDPRAVHFLRAEIFFSDDAEAQAELVFGGRFGEQVASDLTAVPVVLRRRGLPRPKAMAGWFLKRGRPLRVVAAERAPANLMVVRELAERNLDGLMSLAGARRTRYGSTVSIPFGLRPNDRLRFVYPSAVARERRQSQALVQMRSSKDVAGIADGTLFAALTAAFDKELERPMAAQRLTDAVAVAGLLAATGNRPRAVLLIATGESDDRSQFRVRQVRDYLRSIRVPLFVWTPDTKRSDRRWGGVDDASSLQKIARAIDRLRAGLDSQVIVWLEGGHLPSEIELAPQAKGVRLAG